jgi:hypothetical protein
MNCSLCDCLFIHVSTLFFNEALEKFILLDLLVSGFTCDIVMRENNFLGTILFELSWNNLIELKILY